MSTNFLKLPFTAKTSAGRIWLKDRSNIEVYSLNESFCNDILWKANIYRKNEEIVEGFIEKIEKKKEIEFSEKDAESALRGIFLRCEPQIHMNMELENFIPYKATNVSFTLKTNLSEKEQLETHGNISEPGKNCSKFKKIKTSSVVERRDVANVHGLLTTNQILSLEDCAEILAERFPRELITWLTYCTDVQRYQQFYKIV